MQTEDESDRAILYHEVRAGADVGRRGRGGSDAPVVKSTCVRKVGAIHRRMRALRRGLS